MLLADRRAGEMFEHKVFFYVNVDDDDDDDRNRSRSRSKAPVCVFMYYAIWNLLNYLYRKVSFVSFFFILLFSFLLAMKEKADRKFFDVTFAGQSSIENQGLGHENPETTQNTYKERRKMTS